MLKTFKHIFQAIEFLRLPKDNRRVVFYSEGISYWPIFKGLIDGILNQSQLNICYISSGEDDPGFEYNNKRFKTFLIDDSYVRNWLFENLQADLLIMTMPDLNQYQLKKSKYPVHYIYVQHALVSLHMAYRHGAFDWFNTVFCAGPHHIDEIRCIEEQYNLPKKTLIEHGYARFDSIINNNYQEKINNERYKEIKLVPLEVYIREEIGVIVSIDDLTSSLINSLTYKEVDLNKYIFNIGRSDFYGVKYILDMVEN